MPILLFKHHNTGVVADPHWNYVTALFHFDGVYTPSNNSPLTVNKTAGTSTYSNTSKGGQSLISNGNAIGFANSTATQVGTGDFTVEFWMYYTAPPTKTFNCNSIISIGTYTSQDITIAAWADNKASTLSPGMTSTYSIGVEHSGSNAPLAFGDVSLQTWNHIALSRTSRVCKFFINGVELASWSDVTYPKVGGALSIFGLNGTGSVPPTLHLLIDELRITKGVGRYTSNFVPQDIFPDS